MNYTIRYEETGENRPPRAGEWFRGYNGEQQAHFDFSCQSFPILRMELVPVDRDSHCIECGEPGDPFHCLDNDDGPMTADR